MSLIINFSSKNSRIKGRMNMWSDYLKRKARHRFRFYRFFYVYTRDTMVVIKLQCWHDAYLINNFIDQSLIIIKALLALMTWWWIYHLLALSSSVVDYICPSRNWSPEGLWRTCFWASQTSGRAATDVESEKARGRPAEGRLITQKKFNCYSPTINIV